MSRRILCWISIASLFAFIGCRSNSNTTSNGPTVAKVKKKDGNVVEGVINGFIVQKQAVEKEQGGGKNYSAHYVLTAGEETESINEEGVRPSSYSIVSIVESDRPLEDERIIGAVNKALDTQRLQGEGDRDVTMSLGSGPGIKMIARINLPKMVTRQGKSITGSSMFEVFKGDEKLPLLGSCNYPGHAIDPILEIKTRSGVVKIPIDEIIEFNKR